MIIDQLKPKIIEYKKAGDELRLGVLRYLLSLVQNKEIELRPSGEVLNDEMVFKIIRKEIKNRLEAIEMYKKGNRQDLVSKEESELDIWVEFAKLFPFEIGLPNLPEKYL